MPVGPEELLDADDTPEPAGKSLFFQSKSFQAKSAAELPGGRIARRLMMGMDFTWAHAYRQ